MKKIVSSLLAVTALLSANTANAASTYTWSGASSSTWDTTTAGNWSPAGGPPGSADTAVFNTVGPNPTITIGTVAISDIQFGAATGPAAKAFFLGATAGTGTINIANGAGTFLSYLGGSTNTLIQTVNSNLVIGSGTDASTYTISNAAAGALVVKGAISSGSSGAQTLNVTSTAGGKINLNAISGNEAVGLSAGTGTIALLATNSYLGGTTISSGTVVDNAMGAFGANGSSVALNGGTLDIFLAGTTNTFNVTVGGNAAIVSDRSTLGQPGLGYVLGSLSIGASQLTVSEGTTNVTGGTPRIIFGSSSANSTLTDNGGTTEFTSTTAAFVIGGILFGSATGTNVDTLILDGTYDGGGAAGTASKLTGLVEDGGLGGKIAIVKNGSGSWALSNSTTSTSNYTGGTTVNAGTLYLAGTAGMGSTGAAVTLNGGTLDYFLGSSSSTVYNYTVGTGGTGTPTIASDSTTGAGFAYTLGTLSIGANTLDITKGGGVTSGTAGISFGAATLTSTASGTTTLIPTTGVATLASVTGSATSGNTDTLDLDGTSAGNSITGVIADGSGTGKLALLKTGASTWTLGGANTFTGATTIGAGTLNVATVTATGTAQPLGKGTVLNLGVAGTSSGVLNYTGATGTLSGMTINVLGNGSDTITNTGTGTLTLSDSIVKNGTTFNVTGKVNINGVISGSSANSDMNYNGATSTVSMAGTYNGPTRIFNGSTVTNGINDALPDTTGGATANTAVTLGDASETTSQTNIYALGGFNQTVGGIFSTNGGHADTNAIIGGGTGTSTLTVNVASGSDTYSGLLGTGTAGASSGNNLALAKSGAGSLALTTANTYTGGTSITAGKIYVSASSGSATGTGAVGVSGSTAQLAGTGTVAGSVTLSSGGSLYSGGVASGTPTTGAGSGMTLSSTLNVNGGNLTFALGAGTTGIHGGTASDPYDFTNPNSNTTYLSLSGSTSVNFTGTDSITLIDLTNTTGSNGSLSLRQSSPYVLMTAASNANYHNLVINSGTDANPIYSLSQNDATVNGWVVGVYTGGAVNGTDVTAIGISQYGADGMTALTPGANGTYPAPALYLDAGNLEVVPEPGTWALMLGGLALLVVIQRRRKI